MELLASCAFGLEKLVQLEIKNLGYKVLKTEDGRITFEGDQSALIRANLWLRCANRVQIKITEFNATTFDQLFEAIKACDWQKYIGQDDAFPIKASSSKSMLHSEPTIQSIVKKAVVTKLQNYYQSQNLSESSGIVYQIVVKATKDQFTVGIDSSGESLHKRGLRPHANSAPIKETLAAAFIKLSDWNPNKTLVDPFCGSGTIALEAELFRHNIAPGRSRNFAFKNWPWIDQEKIKAAYEQVNRAEIKGEKPPIYCFDIDPESLKIAEENAKNSGIENINIKFKRADFNDLDFTKFENCTFITNPPYGERLDEKEHVIELYKKLGQKFFQTKNCTLYIITPEANLPLLFGHREDKNRKLFNGTIKCYLFSYHT